MHQSSQNSGFFPNPRRVRRAGRRDASNISTPAAVPYTPLITPRTSRRAGGSFRESHHARRPMAKLRIGKEILKNALDRAVLSDAEKATLDRLLAAAAAKGPV